MYRSVEVKFWSDPWIRKQDFSVRYLYLYLITNAHTHPSGLYNISLDTIIKETGLLPKQVRYGIDTLSKTHRCRIDTQSEVVWVCKMHLYQCRGGKMRRAIEKHILNFHPSELLADFCDTLSIGVHIRNRIQEQKQEAEAEKNASEDSPVSYRENSVESTLLSQIVSAWNEIIPAPKARGVTAERKRHIKARIHGGDAGNDITWWREYFIKISESRFLMQGHNWFTFDWCLNQQNMTKILEGAYHRDKGNGKAPEKPPVVPGDPSCLLCRGTGESDDGRGFLATCECVLKRLGDAR